MDLQSAYRFVFVGYSVANLGAAAIYLLLTDQLEVRKSAQLATGLQITSDAKRVVRRISALFALDAGGGGFLADALLAYWFFQRFGMNEQSLGLLFFVVRVLNATSHL